MSINWKRPDSVPFPSVWSRFEGKREINGKIPKFWIQDIPEDMFDEAAEMMLKNFIYDEPLCKYSRLSEDNESYEEVKVLWQTLVRQKIGLICFMENNNGKPIIVGLNMTYPSTKEDTLPEFKGKKWLQVLNTVMYLTKIKDPYSMFGIDKYMNAMGLSVFPEFRGQGIGDELLKARTPLCKAVGIPATLTVFTATASQKLAERNGFEEIATLSYEELEKINPSYTFPGISETSKQIRYMYKMIE